MVDQKLTVSQFHLGMMWRGVAGPRFIQTSTATAASKAPRIQAEAPPRFSVHLPMRRPTRFVPSAIQIAARELSTR